MNNSIATRPILTEFETIRTLLREDGAVVNPWGIGPCNVNMDRHWGIKKKKLSNTKDT